MDATTDIPSLGSRVPISQDDIKKTFVLPKALWRRISRFRHRRELRTESEAARQLFELALEIAERDEPEAPEKPRGRKR
jgi:hypothetical protein